MPLTVIVAWPSVMRVLLEVELALCAGSAYAQALAIPARWAFRYQFRLPGTEATG